MLTDLEGMLICGPSLLGNPTHTYFSAGRKHMIDLTQNELGFTIKYDLTNITFLSSKVKRKEKGI